MAKWFVEEGIGEHRAILLTYEGIEEARLSWPGTGLVAGTIADATLLEVPREGRAAVRFACGQIALGRKIPRQTSVGASVRMEVLREAMAETGRLKFAQARRTVLPPAPAPTLTETLRAEGMDVEVVRQFPAFADWSDLWSQAAEQTVEFPGGNLVLADTPAMTVIDIDGHDLQAEALAIQVARTLRRLDLAGSIGIDFPTFAVKEDRQTIDQQLAFFLRDWPHEKTAMNGFGFVQIVRRLQRPSLLRRIARDPAGAAARFALREAERLEGAGQTEISAHPWLCSALTPEWLEELRRRTGRDVVVRPDPGLALTAPHAQIVPL